MPDTEAIWEVIARNVPDLIRWWSDWAKRKAAADAAGLMFWPDGVLQELKIIANGEASERDFRRLKKKFDDSQADVDRIIEGLKKSRRQIQKKRGGIAVVRQINEILFNDSMGKSNIRLEISDILRQRESYLKRNADLHQSIGRRAQRLCNSIDAFNASVSRLHGLLNSP